MTPPENDVAVVAPPPAVRQLTGRRAARALAQARLRLVVPGRVLAPWEKPEAGGADARRLRPPGRQSTPRAPGAPPGRRSLTDPDRP